VPQCRNVLCGVAIDRDEIGQHPRLHLANLHVEHLSGHRCSGLQRPRRAHPIGHHQLDFAGILAVVEDAYVAAAEDRHASRHRRLEAGAFASNAGRFGTLALAPSGILRGRIPRSQSGAQRDMMFRHHLEDFRRASIAVLDRIHARHKRAAHPLGSG
jgi:hypothetical protein